jgi:hypothetical protein
LKFTSLLQGIYKSLPLKSKRIAQGIFRTSKENKGKKAQSAALATVLETRGVTLPPDVHDLFQVWKQNPTKFWKARGELLGIHWDSRESTDSVASEAYFVVRRLNSQRLWDTILWRFYASFFYDLALLLGNGQVNLTNGLYQRLLEVLSQSEKITDDIVTIESNIRAWTAAGSRYNKICKHLDKGALFLLPHLSDNV